VDCVGAWPLALSLRYVIRSSSDEGHAMPPITEWAIIADASRARILEREGPRGTWAEQSDGEDAPPNPRSHDQGADRPGRVQESVGGARHAIEPRNDPHRAAKRAFAHHLAERLEREATAGRFARLVLIAPPHFLGDLRDALGRQSQERLAGSLDKDLVQHSRADIVAHLDALAAS